MEIFDENLKKKKFITIVAFLLVLILLVLAFLSIPRKAFAYSVNVDGTGTTINPTDKQLKKAMDGTKYTDTSVSITASTTSTENADIFHYEAPYEGYYAIYSLSSKDMVGKIYEHKNFLWWSTRFEELQTKDDGSLVSNNNRDFSIVERFERKENYLIAVRGFSNYNTGSYTLKIEPNEDKKLNKCGGMWKGEYMDSASAILNQWTMSKQYLTKQEMILLYIYANPATRAYYGDACGTKFEDIIIAYKNNPNKALSVSLDILGLIPGMPYGASVSITALGWILDIVKNGETSFLEMICEKSGIVHNIDNGEITAERGLLIEKSYTGGMIPYTTEYKTFNDEPDEILTGDKYCKGVWR